MISPSYIRKNLLRHLPLKILKKKNEKKNPKNSHILFLGLKFSEKSFLEISRKLLYFILIIFGSLKNELKIPVKKSKLRKFDFIKKKIAYVFGG